MIKLWIITDATQSDADIAARARDACAACGAEICVHLRDKRARRRELAFELSEITRAHGSMFVIGDHEDLAAEVGALAHGWSARAPYSLSAHDDHEVVRADARGARAILVSPIFDSPNKGPARGTSAIASAARITRASLYALGGVDAQRARACVDAGATGVAVIRAVFGARDAGEAARALLTAVRGA